MEEIGINSPPERLRKQLALERGIRAEGYSGKKQWLVCHDVYGGCQIYAKTMVDALWTAAKVWGVKPQSREFHPGSESGIPLPPP